MAYSVDPDQAVPENDILDLDLDQAAENGKNIDLNQIENGKQCRPWSDCWEYQVV